jgi:hypothetical protein
MAVLSGSTDAAAPARVTMRAFFAVFSVAATDVTVNHSSLLWAARFALPVTSHESAVTGIAVAATKNRRSFFVIVM